MRRNCLSQAKSGCYSQRGQNKLYLFRGSLSSIYKLNIYLLTETEMFPKRMRNFDVVEPPNMSFVIIIK